MILRENGPGVKRLLPLLCGLLLLGPRVNSASVELRIHGTSLSLDARNASVYDILSAFASYGISVEAQPGIQAFFNGILSETPIDEALDQILLNFPHNTTWREIPYGGGYLRILSGIQVYASSPSDPDPLKRIAPAPRKIAARSTGEAFIADELLLGLRAGTDLNAFRRLLASMGGQVISAHIQSGIYRIRLPRNTNLPALLDQLAQNDLVALAEPNFVYPLIPEPRGGETALTVNGKARPILRIPSDIQPALAIIDSGLNPEQVPPQILRASHDVTGANLPWDDPVGHGTHMALIAAGITATPGHGPGGEAVPLVTIRGLDADGNTHSFAILESLTLAAEAGARVISMSWGAYTESALLSHAFAQAADQGLLLLASAGNDGKARLMFPASHPSVLSVGAAGPDGTREPYSNHGPELDLLAPGTAVLNDGSQQTLLRGTSMATPWVAAALTAYFSRHPDATPEEAVSALRASLIPDLSGETKTPGLFNEAARAQFLQTEKADQ